jgi:hypothetical protein
MATAVTPARAAHLDASCATAGIAVEPFSAGGHRYAWVRGLGECGIGVSPHFALRLTIRDGRGTRRPRWTGSTKVAFRYYGGRASVSAHFVVSSSDDPRGATSDLGPYALP